MHDHDDIDFAMFDSWGFHNTRPGPARATAAPEQDPVEKRLQEDREAARFRVLAAIEVKHGSGKVKV